ncbi:MAG: hypothetical protein KME45_28730 [Stenomitos rutilans HA7619-LM2]|jgi:hypothetical protein|nr:hypothetical protein [Stenomitos rutilans HA7619-LM2]
MAKLALSGRTAKSKLVAEAQREAERMQDVRLLLDHLLRQEAVTVKFILDRLYDVGSVNLINQKVRSQPLNQLTKAIAVMSKPAFKVFAQRWLNKNCSRLITNWLYRKVRFNTPDAQPAVTATKVLEAQATPSLTPSLDPVERAASAQPVAAQPVASARLVEPEQLVERDRQIQQLQHQVRWLTGLLVGVILLWGGSIVLPHYIPSSNSLQSLEKAQP